MARHRVITHKVITADAEIDRAIERARGLQDEPRVTKVEYRSGRGLDLLILTMNDGHRHMIPREDLQGLQSATKAQIASVEIVGQGTGLHWPALDLDLYVPALLRRIYGNRSWMTEIGRKGGQVKSVTKRKTSRMNGSKGGRPRHQRVDGEGGADALARLFHASLDRALEAQKEILERSARRSKAGSGRTA
jgi:Protein of unknown function (DUF2442)